MRDALMAVFFETQRPQRIVVSYEFRVLTVPAMWEKPYKCGSSLTPQVSPLLNQVGPWNAGCTYGSVFWNAKAAKGSREL